MNPIISDKRLELAIEAAKKAGDKTASVKHSTERERKQNDTFVTDADREAERIIRELLKDRSEYPLLGEEQGGDVENEHSYWVIDPIDGTQNFAYQQPLYGSSVALVEENEPVVGVFYLPELDYVFYAVEGEGAYRNQERISVTSQTDIDSAYYILTGKGKSEFQNGIKSLNDWNQQLSSALMAECWVASGWVDIGVIGALAPWDMAAGVVLVRESGGVVKHVQTGDSTWDDISEGKVIIGAEEAVDSARNELPTSTITTILDSTYDY